jgi:hypothetical protein
MPTWNDMTRLCTDTDQGPVNQRERHTAYKPVLTATSVCLCISSDLGPADAQIGLRQQALQTRPTFPSIPQRECQDGIQNRSQPLPSTAFTIHYSNIRHSCINPLEPSGYYMYHQP